MKQLTDTFSISGQLDRSALQALKDRGVTTIVNARCADEPNQPIGSHEMAQLVQEMGMRYVCIPVKPLQYSQQDVDNFGDAVKHQNAHAYCMTGTRAAHLWALSQAKAEQKVDDIVACCSKQGCDLSAIQAQLNDLGKVKSE